MVYLLLIAIGLGHVVFYSELNSLWYLLTALMCLASLLLYTMGLVQGRAAPQWLLVGRARAFWRCFPLVSRLCWALTAFSLGAAIGCLQLQAIIAGQLPETLDKQTLTLVFDVEKVQRHSEHSPVQLGVKVVTADLPAQPPFSLDQRAPSYDLQGKALRLSWRDPTSEVLAGQRWQAKVVVRRPRGFVNPQGFDFAAWVLGQGYQATGYLNAQSTPVLLGFTPSLLHRLRSHLGHKFAAAGDAKPFFEALLLGQLEGISPDQWQVLQATGTVHLMAISGLHVGLVAALGFLLGLWLVRGIMRAGLSDLAGWSYRLVPSLLAIMLAAAYSLLAGMAVPTRRALLAVIFVNIALMLGVKSSRWQMFALVLLLVVLSEPMAALQAGFWLSFTAVAVLMALLGGQHLVRADRRQWRWQQALYLQCLLTLAMTLPLWLLGLPSSVLSPVANLVAVPVVAMLIVPALLFWVPLSFTPLSDIFIVSLAALFKGLWWGLEVLANLPYAAFWASQTGNGWTLVLGLLALILLLAPRSICMRAASASVLVLLLLGMQPVAAPFELVVLDVGQGLAVAIHEQEHTLLYDTGPVFSDRFNAGANIIAPYLRTRGIGMPLMPPSSMAFNSHFSVMVSHGDKDHSGGFPAIAQLFAPAEVWVGEAFAGMPPRATPCQQGQHWRWQQAEYSVLWPPHDADPPWQNNNASCVLLIEIDGIRILLTGDIEADVEQQLVATASLAKVDVLIAPHHGSKTSSTRSFLQKLAPAHVVVSAGYKSPYGHPHSSIVERYDAIGAKVWNTAAEGAIVLKVERGVLSVKGQRHEQPRLWF